MKKTLALATAVAGLVAASAAFASAAPVMMTGITNPWYVGIGANYTAIQTDKDTFTVRNDTTTDDVQGKLNSRSVGGNLFVGYLVNKYFGTELGFSYLGTNKYKLTDNGVADGSLKIKDQWNAHFVANAYLPVTDWFSPYAFGGVGYMSYKADVSSNSITNVADHTYGGFGLVYGAGLQFNIDQFGIRASYTVQDDANNSFHHNNDATDFVSLDVLYRFGN